MKLLRCALCLSLVYASILTRTQQPSAGGRSPSRLDEAVATRTGDALRAAGEVVGRTPIAQAATELSTLCGARAACDGLAPVIAALVPMGRCPTRERDRLTETDAHARPRSASTCARAGQTERP